MRFVIRTDASSQIGTGHVMRCLSLADALRGKEVSFKFVCRNHKGNLINLITRRGYEVSELLTPTRVRKHVKDNPTHASWLGVDWELDAEQTLAALDSEEIDWLIVDHYALDSRWERKLRCISKRIMVIDDLADRSHDCDLLLDQNFGVSIKEYNSLLPTYCKFLYGPSYALLNPVYAQHHAKTPERDGRIRRALIYFGGGADPSNLTCLALRAFEAKELAPIELDIVVGSAYAHERLLRVAAAQRGRACIHTQIPNLVELMSRADVAIGAGGATTWERCCMGLPSIVVSIGDNQVPACQALAEKGLIDYVGHTRAVTPELIRQRLAVMVSKPEFLRELSTRVRALVDGKGVFRVTKAIKRVTYNSNATPKTA
jgi:UDP-2,4-diacetamido-2,4,6-trideoxy-beta-L-altropyranose hydrolase